MRKNCSPLLRKKTENCFNKLKGEDTVSIMKMMLLGKKFKLLKSLLFFFLEKKKSKSKSGQKNIKKNT